MEIPRKTSILREPMRNVCKRSRATNCGVVVSIEEGLFSYLPQRRCQDKSVSLAGTQKAAVENNSTAASCLSRSLLRHSQRLQRWLINCGGFIKPVIALVTRDCLTCKGPQQPVHITLIIALRLQRRLDIGDDLIRRQAVVSVDGTIIRVVRIGSVTPCRVPPTRIPIITCAIYEND